MTSSNLAFSLWMGRVQINYAALIHSADQAAIMRDTAPPGLLECLDVAAGGSRPQVSPGCGATDMSAT